MKKKLLPPTRLYQEVSKRRQYVTQVHQELSDRLKKYPEGKLRISVKEKHVDYYLRKSSNDYTGNYIHKSETKLIKTYLQKSYDEKLLKIISKELHDLDKLLSHQGIAQKQQDDIRSNYHNTHLNPNNTHKHPSVETMNYYTDQVRNLYSQYPSQARELITPYDISDEEYARRWQEMPYEQKSIGANPKDYFTDKNEQVRSMSEMNIANMLYKYNIPYRYECALNLKGVGTIYPDFTVLDVCNRRVIYWEHRGMMDDIGYVRESVSRLRDYNSNNIITGNNLIITEGTSDKPLGIHEIDRVISCVFLK